MAETSKFDTLAADYAAARPTYPAAVLDGIERLSGRSLAGSQVADIGAGTGIAARLLQERGARVTAVELSAGMLKELAATSPGVASVRGSANAVPLRDDSMDFITFAQAWHWVDPEVAVPETLRVLRPGGALACFWNNPVPTAAWRTGYHDRIRELLGRDPEYGNASSGPDQTSTLFLGPFADRLEVRTAEVPWSRKITFEQRIANVRSRSYMSEVSPEQAREFLAGEHAFLAERFPDGFVEEEYSTWLGVVVV